MREKRPRVDYCSAAWSSTRLTAMADAAYLGTLLHKFDMLNLMAEVTPRLGQTLLRKNGCAVCMTYLGTFAEQSCQSTLPHHMAQYHLIRK